MVIIMKLQNIKLSLKEYRHLFVLALLGVPIGIIVGCLDTIFAKGLIYVHDLRVAHPYYFIPFLSIIGVLIVFSGIKLQRDEKFGINLVFAVGLGDATRIPLRMIPYVIISTWLTNLFGGSAGREGVALQIGATVANRFGRKLPLKNATDVFLITGIAAGFAGLFITPISAILFAIEVLIVGEIEFKAFMPALTASFSAAITSELLGLTKWTYDINFHLNLNYSNTAKILFLGIIFGLVGGLFSFALRHTKTFFERKIQNPLWRIFIVGIIISIGMIIFKGEYSGVGSNLIEKVFNGGNVPYYDWILKFAFTVLTLSVGFIGGEIAPLFAIGATLGCVIAPYVGFPPEFVAALGFASVFGSATNTFFAPIFIGAEIFGFETLPYFFVVCAIGYFCNLNRSIYTLQKVN